MHPSAAFTGEVVGHIPAWLDTTRLLAHQGGWDEILMVLVPVSVFAALLYVANQRAMRMAARESSEGTPDPSAGNAPSDADSGPHNERGGPI